MLACRAVGLRHDVKKSKCHATNRHNEQIKNKIHINQHLKRVKLRTKRGEMMQKKFPSKRRGLALAVMVAAAGATMPLSASRMNLRSKRS